MQDTEVFRRNIFPPSLRKTNMKSAEAGEKLNSVWRLPLLVFCWAYSSNLKMQEIYFSKMLGSLQTTRRHKPEDSILHIHLHDNLKPNILSTVVKIFTL
jgi:hypothetical protein